MFLRVMLLIAVALGSDCIAQNARGPANENPTSVVRSDEVGDAAPPALATPIPPDCNQAELLKMGHPVFVGERRSVDLNVLRKSGQAVLGSSLSYGVSLEKLVFEEGEPVVFHIWVDNPSDQAAFTMSCSDIERVGDSEIHLYDAEGRRLESLSESVRVAKMGAKSLADACTGIGRNLLYPPGECLMNVPIEIPAHTCRNTGDGNPAEFFSRDLRNMYDLPPGRYAIRTHTAKTVAYPCDPESNARWHDVPGRDITFEIRPRQAQR